MRSVISNIESDITKNVKREIEKQLLELKVVSNSIDQRICQVQDQCLQLKVNFTTQNSVYQYCDAGHQNSPIPISNLLSIDSNLFLIQEQAKGGYTVAGAVIGSFFGGFGAPVGAAIGASLGEQRRKQTFKKFYKPESLSVIKAKLNLQNVNQKVNQYVITTIGSLKTSAYRVRQQTEAIIDSIEQDISTFQGKREVEAVAEQRRLDQLMSEIQKILDDSHLLLSRLT